MKSNRIKNPTKPDQTNSKKQKKMANKERGDREKVSQIDR